MRRADERDLIARFLRHATPDLPPGAVGPGDDAAVLPWSGREDLVVSSDQVAAGVHFLPDTEPSMIGRFLVAVNLSDLAAMGAVPRGFLASYAAPPDQDEVWLDGIARGVAAGLREWECPLLGGDTKQAPAVVLTGTALGAVPQGTAVRRTGAHPGDVLVLTGPIGGPGAVLERLAKGEMTAEEAGRLLLDVAPRLAAGAALRTAGATAMVDLSDGLARGARLLSDGASCGAELMTRDLPLADAVRASWSDPRPADEEWRRIVLGTGGEYELLAALSPDRLDAARSVVAATGCHLHVVGRMHGPSGVRLLDDRDSWSVGDLGWRHFHPDGGPPLPDP